MPPDDHLSSAQLGFAWPDPGILARYKEVMPGLEDQVLEALRQQVRHRHRLEVAESRRETLSLVLAFLIAVSFLSASAWLISGGHEVAGSVVATVDLVALTTAFIVGRHASWGE